MKNAKSLNFIHGILCFLLVAVLVLSGCGSNGAAGGGDSASGDGGNSEQQTALETEADPNAQLSETGDGSAIGDGFATGDGSAAGDGSAVGDGSAAGDGFDNGNAGYAGDTGNAGYAGDAGNAGYPGNAGDAGNAGYPGYGGNDANSGYAGDAGDASQSAGQAMPDAGALGEISGYSATGAQNSPLTVGQYARRRKLPAVYDPNPSYDKYALVEYSIDDMGADFTATVSARSDGSEYEVHCTVGKEEQVAILDASYAVLYDRTGKLGYDAPQIVQQAVEEDDWKEIGE